MLNFSMLFSYLKKIAKKKIENPSSIIMKLKELINNCLSTILRINNKIY